MTWRVLDQAVGLIAGTLGVDPTAARTAITAYAERHQRALREVARAVAEGSLAPADLAIDNVPD